MGEAVTKLKKENHLFEFPRIMVGTVMWLNGSMMMMKYKNNTNTNFPQDFDV